MAGSFVAAAAFVLSTFSKSVTMMMITYGLIGGESLFSLFFIHDAFALFEHKSENRPVWEAR